MKNLFYTSPKYLQNLKGIESSASEIDDTIKNSREYLIPTLNENDDMTSIIQAKIDEIHNIYMSKSKRLSEAQYVYIPKGMYKIENLYIKSGVKLHMDGVFRPLYAASNMIYIAGSYIDIDTLKIECRDVAGYVGKALIMDTTDTNTSSLLALAPLNSITNININILSLKGMKPSVNIGMYIKSHTVSRGITRLRISNIDIRDFNNGIKIECTDTGYFNSNFISGCITHSINSIDLTAISGEIAYNNFNMHIQPRNENNVTGIRSYGASANEFNGVIWDWLENYGYNIYDTGNKNIYSESIISTSFPHKLSIFGLATKQNSFYENVNNFNCLYNWGENARNSIGFEDNILAFADKLYTCSVSPSKSSTFYKAFRPSEAINWAWNTTWPSSDGAGEIILTISGIPASRVHTIGVGFQKASRIAKGVKLEYKYSTGNWTTLMDRVDNLSNTVLFRANGGSGYDFDSLRFTFTNGVNADDMNNISIPSSNTLAIQSIAVFGAGEKRGFLRTLENKQVGFVSTDATTILNNSVFIDSSDNLLKFKNSTGVIKTIQLL